MFDKPKNKVEDLANDHPDQVEKVSDKTIDGAGDMVDQRTGDKYEGQVDKAQEFLDGKIGDDGRHA